MSYQALTLRCDTEFNEILMAELAAIGFANFEETEKGINAYANESEVIDEESIQEVIERYSKLCPIEYDISEIKKENWNANWERNYQPIRIEDKIIVRADFHPIDENFQTEIIVTPKMSFGTGHHETTYQMLKLLYGMDLKGKSILDAGCGTGILGILAMKRGAQKIDAYDIDEWAKENTLENFSLNRIENEKFNVWQGEVDSIPANKAYDIIIANINKNILLHDLPFYSRHLIEGGHLLLSGFYQEDIDDILNESEKYSLELLDQSERNNWVALSLKKIK